MIMMYFCFLAKIVSFQKVAQNFSSRLKRAIQSRTQQHTMSQFVYETNSRLACRNFRPSRISTAHDSMPQTQGCVRYSLENQPCIKQRPMQETALKNCHKQVDKLTKNSHVTQVTQQLCRTLKTFSPSLQFYVEIV